MNTLYYGDNLDVLRRHVKDESVDLVYLDPPFNSNANYNVLFREHGDTPSAAQIEAFADTWRWDAAAAASFQDAVNGGGRVADALLAMRTFIGQSDMLAYLSMMAPRLVELRRVLKPTGSIYLHCDPTASHYLKLLMDAIYGAENFQGEIVWRRTSSHVTARRWARLHDTILAYAADVDRVAFHPPRVAADAGWIEREYRHADERGRYSLADLTGAGTRSGPSGEPWRDVDPKAIGSGRHWRYLPDTLDRLDAEGRIYWPQKGRYPKLKQYLEDMAGKPVGDIWDDIPVLGRTAAERLGYPTQKPGALLERIINASSTVGDVVLDPFCGCGTSVAAAQKLGRRWIGIDVTHLAIGLIKNRLRDAHGLEPGSAYRVVGEPTDEAGAAELAATDPYQFQWWALGLVGARPAEGKKGADKGIDGRIVFFDEWPNGKPKQVILSVKAGKTQANHVRDLVGVLDREGAAIGVLISMQEPTKPMRAEAADAGHYESPHFGSFPRLQLLTIHELLGGARVKAPPLGQVGATFKKAPKHVAAQGEQASLDV